VWNALCFFGRLYVKAYLEKIRKMTFLSSLLPVDLQFSDGYLDLILVRDCPQLSLLSLMSELNHGNHVKSPYVMYLKVSNKKTFSLVFIIFSFLTVEQLLYDVKEIFIIFITCRERMFLMIYMYIYIYIYI